MLQFLELMNEQDYCYFYQFYVHVIVLYPVSMGYIYDYDDDKIFQND